MAIYTIPQDAHLLDDFLRIMEEKRHYRSYNRKVSIRDLSRSCDWQRVRSAARKYLPLQEHEICGYVDICGQCSCYYTGMYENERNIAFRAIFGKEWNPLEYRISCVCREEFSEATKQKLREYYNKAQAYRALSTALRLMVKGSRI